MTDPTRLLRDLNDAFAEGRDRRPFTTEASSGRLYTELLFESLSARLSQAELSFLICCLDGNDEALGAARRDRLAESRRRLDAVRGLIEGRRISELARLFIEAMLEPVGAYLCYKLGDYDRAADLILHAASLGQTLIAGYDLPIMSGHRLQLGLNLLVIHARRGARREAILLGGEFLDSIELRREGLSGRLACSRSSLAALPDPVRDDYFDKFGGNIALLLAGEIGDEIAEDFRPLAHHADPAACKCTDLGVRSHTWLRGKQLAIRGEIEQFLALSMEQLRLGRMSEPSVWFATVLDIIGFCRSLGRAGRGLADRMVAELSGSHDSPWVLKRSLGLI